MIKQKFDEPKEQLKKEINNQKNRLERIKKAYIDGVFELEEYNKERKIVEKAITELEEKLGTTDCTEELCFTQKDILLKRDIDYINKLKLNKEYTEKTKTWKDYTRAEQADLVMRYVDNIELELIGKGLSLEEATKLKEQRVKEDTENNTECCENAILGKYGRARLNLY